VLGNKQIAFKIYNLNVILSPFRRESEIEKIQIKQFPAQVSITLVKQNNKNNKQQQQQQNFLSCTKLLHQPSLFPFFAKPFGSAFYFSLLFFIFQWHGK